MGIIKLYTHIKFFGVNLVYYPIMSHRKEILPLITAGSMILSGCGVRVSKLGNVLDPNFTPGIKPALTTLLYEQGEICDLGNSYQGIESEAISFIEELVPTQVVAPRFCGSQENLNWQLDEIWTIRQVIDLLPPSFREPEVIPHQLALLRLASSPYYIDGGYEDRRIRIILGPNYSSPGRAPSSLERYVDNGLMALQFATIHEWGHAFNDAHPDIVANDWAKATGWTQNPQGFWSNERYLEIPDIGSSRYYPVEDFANAVAIRALNVDGLSASQINFFETNPYFSDWKVPES